MPAARAVAAPGGGPGYSLGANTDQYRIGQEAGGALVESLQNPSWRPTATGQNAASRATAAAIRSSVAVRAKRTCVELLPS